MLHCAQYSVGFWARVTWVTGDPALLCAPWWTTPICYLYTCDCMYSNKECAKFLVRYCSLYFTINGNAPCVHEQKPRPNQGVYATVYAVFSKS